jgi:uncharacterized membrane protein (DUF373 family)
MTENRENQESSGFDVNSKFWRTTLVIAAVILIFVGPTYVPYLFVDILKVEYFAAIGVGFVLLIVGLVLLWYLIRKKVIE